MQYPETEIISMEFDYPERETGEILKRVVWGIVTKDGFKTITGREVWKDGKFSNKIKSYSLGKVTKLGATDEELLLRVNG